MQTFCAWKWVISKSHDLQIVQKCEFWKWGHHYSNGHPARTVEHYANIFTVEGTWNAWLFQDAKSVAMSFYILKKINEMQMAR